VSEVSKIVEQSNKIRETLETELKELQNSSKAQLEKSAQINLDLEHQIVALKLQIEHEKKVRHFTTIF
jgi:predicted RNase H-like nuclease (RuvC/YqgF family)